MLTALTERIAYLRGLADGLDVREKSAEGKLLMEIVGILDEMEGQFRELHKRLEETEDYVEAIDEDLEDLEDVELFLFEEEQDLCETVSDCEDSDAAYAASYDLDDGADARLYESLDDEHLETTYEFACPSCQELIFLQEGVDEDGYYHFVIEPSHPDVESLAINPT